MNLKISYFDNNLSFNNESIQVIEIENKKMFYRLISDLVLLKNGEKLNELYFFDDKNEELNIGSRVEVYVDFFQIDLNSKKNISALTKKISSNLTDIEKDELFNSFKKLYKSFNRILNEFELPIVINDNLIIEDILKLFKISFKASNDLLDNLLLLIEIEKSLNLNEILFFINLKQYLNKDELEELYKYAIYNSIKIVLIDSQSYGATINYEKKLIIDNDLEEYVL
ncbi:MAG: type II-A CRISPR-associated protein Csn2 [Bacilli bacterium]|nr:type II-A CRISPR-associated protein Csn2 [Bacilli bacterium]